MDSKDSDFFIILRAGLWHIYDGGLSVSPDWDYIINTAIEQTVLGVISDGIDFLFNKQSAFVIPSIIQEKIITQVAITVRTNVFVNEVLSKVCLSLNNNGIDYVALKGQSFLPFYARTQTLN